MYLIVEFLPDSSINPLAKFGRFRSSSYDPIKEIKTHLNRYKTYKANFIIRVFKVTSIKGKKARGLEKVFKQVLKKCEKFTEEVQDIEMPDILKSILYVYHNLLFYFTRLLYLIQQDQCL